MVISAVVLIFLPVYSESSKGIVEIFWQNVAIDIFTFLVGVYFILRGIIIRRRQRRSV